MLVLGWIGEGEMRKKRHTSEPIIAKRRQTGVARARRAQVPAACRTLDNRILRESSW
jgi:hypothetical protein